MTFPNTTFTDKVTRVVSTWLQAVNDFCYNVGTSLGATLVGYLSTALGAVLRTVAGKLSENLSVFDFMTAAQIADVTAGTLTLDVSAPINTALVAAATLNKELIFPNGIYGCALPVSLNGVAASASGKSVRLTGQTSTIDGNVGGVIIKWTGGSSSSNTLFTANGLAKLYVSGISFHGANKVGNVFLVTYSGSTYSPFGWEFDDCSFEAALPNFFAYRITGTSGCAVFTYTNCHFRAGAGAISYKCENSNALNHQFYGCQFDFSAYGVWMAGGSFNSHGSSFGVNSVVDIYLQQHSPISMIGDWSEQSYMFLHGDVRSQYSAVTMVNTNISSYPWSYWKISNETVTQPTNDYTQWMAVQWDRPGGLVMLGCQFQDPYNGASVGAIAPLTSSLVTAGTQSGTGARPSMSNVGSFSQSAANTYIDSFFVYGGSVLAPLVPMRKATLSFTAGGGVTLSPYLTRTNVWTLNANTTVTLPTTAFSEPEDEVVIVFIQGGGGGFTTGFVNCKIVGGAFTPTAAAGARSMIKLQYDGTFWNEISRGLNLS